MVNRMPHLRSRFSTIIQTSQPGKLSATSSIAVVSTSAEREANTTQALSTKSFQENCYEKMA
jgi:hypothetical protein